MLFSTTSKGGLVEPGCSAKLESLETGLLAACTSSTNLARSAGTVAAGSV